MLNYQRLGDFLESLGWPQKYPATCSWNQRKLDTLKTALVDCSSVEGFTTSAAAMSVKLKIINLSGHLLWGPETLPTSLLGLIGVMGLIGLGPRPSPNSMHQHTRLTYSTFFLVHLFLYQLGFPSLSPNPKVVNTPQDPELVNTGNFSSHMIPW